MTNQSCCIHCYVSGKVQGVWYRASAKIEAERLGLTGWAKNLDDGRVEVFACGTIANLDLFYKWLNQGPPLAAVIDCSREELPWQECYGFDTY